jgi:Tfp pilus assembly protein PilV
MPSSRRSNYAQDGSILLEALIAILLFSMGMLALAGVQAAAIKNAADAKYRAEASFLASQIIAQMWAENPATLANYRHNPTTVGRCNYAGGASGNANVVTWVGSAGNPGTVAGNLPNAGAGRQQIADHRRREQCRHGDDLLAKPFGSDAAQLCGRRADQWVTRSRTR